MAGLAIILVVAALLGAGLALLLASQATLGVSLMAGACLLAILARMAQAQHHQMLGGRRRQPSRPGAWECPGCHYENGAGLATCPQCGTARPSP